MSRWKVGALALSLLAGCGSRALDVDDAGGVGLEPRRARDGRVRQDVARRRDMPGARDLWRRLDRPWIPDRALPPDLPPVPDVLPPPDFLPSPYGPNSGQTCGPMSNSCPGGDKCIVLSGWKKGICVSPCAKHGAPCPTPYPNTLSICALTDPSQSQWFCLYICSAQGKTYPCPDPATQVCAQAGPQYVKICQPK